MDFGSSYVYDYNVSEEENISEEDLKEGMWISDEEDELLALPPPTLAAQFLRRAKTGKKVPLSRQKDDVDDTESDTEDSDDEDEERPPKPAPRAPVYADLVFPTDKTKALSEGATVPSPSDARSPAGAVNVTKFEGSPGKYAKLAELQQEIREGREIARSSEPQSRSQPLAKEAGMPPVQALAPGTTHSVSETAPKSYSVPLRNSPGLPPPPLPPMRPIKGIIRGEIKKQKRQRVRWEQSYRAKKSGSSHGGFRTRKTDTNILAVKFDSLSEQGNLHTGDAQFCSNPSCSSIISHLSQLQGEEQDMEKTWVCEFCGTKNTVDLAPEEIPTKEDTTYLITAAAAMQSEGVAGARGTEESMVVFCMDTSGSMCVTSEVPGHHSLRGAKEKREKTLGSLPTSLDVDFRRRDTQYLPGQRRDTTWVSRMESVCAAVDTQLSQLAHSQPNKRVCLVTFSDDVIVHGDGKIVPVTIAGDKLNDTKALVDIGKDIPLPSTVRETQKALSKKVFSLEESGQTALGPALLVSIVVASQCPGSKVILCTDGLANIGVGAVDVEGGRTDAAYAAVQTFYEELGTIAMDKGVTVSLVTIKGTDCRVAELGNVASRTGGQVTLVDPLTVVEEFTSILANPVLATDVITKIIIHKGLYFRNEESAENVIVKKVGNVTADSEFTYEYGVRRKAAQEKEKASDPKTAGEAASSSDHEVPPLVREGNNLLPFQLQIEYTSLEGDRCLRVITQAKPITRDRTVAERDMDVGVVGSHAARVAADLALQGEYTHARAISLGTQRMLHGQSRSSAQRRWEYENFCTNIIPLENEMKRVQETELSHGRNYSDDEEEVQGVESALTDLSFVSKQPRFGRLAFESRSSPLPYAATKKVKSSKEIHRRQQMSDELASTVFSARTSSSTTFRSPHVSECKTRHETSEDWT